MNVETLKEAIRRELPQFLRTDPELRAYISGTDATGIRQPHGNPRLVP